MLVDNAVEQDLAHGFHFDTRPHRTVELLPCCSGCLSITVQGMVVAVAEGEFIAIFPDVPHSADVLSDQPCRILQAHFHESDRNGGRRPCGCFLTVLIKAVS